MLSYSANALAQYSAFPSVFNPPVPAAPSAGATEGGPTVTAPPPPWLFTPSITLGETLTDNVNLAPPGQARSDLITTISPGLDIVGQTARINLALSYDPQLLLFALGTSSPIVQQRLLGTGRIELYPETLFFDGSASIGQAYVNNAGPIAATTLTTNNNLQTVEAVNASPYLLHHFGSYANTETRYRLSVVSTGAAGIGTQTSNEFIQTVTNGEYFAPLAWTLTGSYRHVDGLSIATGLVGGSSSTDELVKLDTQYPVYRRVSVTAGIGWERIRDPTLVTQPVGPIWDIGLRYDPSPIASMSLSYGDRLIGSDFAFSAKYDVGSETHLNASYTRTVQTTQSLIAANLNGLVIGPGGVLINPQTGLPVVPGSGQFGPGGVPLSLTNSSFIDKRFELDATATRGRNTYSLTAYHDAQSGQVGGTSTRVIGGIVTWTRQLWPDLTSNVSATYANIRFLDGSGRADNYYSASAGFNYALSRSSNMQLSFVRSARESNTVQNSLTDDLVAIYLQKRF